jgi:NAD(P)-dependent dehydrogenase (short-subunit alcohol dehydrogenase family)
MGVPYGAAYCASKGGVIQLTKALAAEYLGTRRARELRRAGGIKTPLQKSFHQLPDGADPEVFRDLMTPLGNSTPAEVAALIAFVASEEGRYMTGAVLSIDGGLTI